MPSELGPDVDTALSPSSLYEMLTSLSTQEHSSGGPQRNASLWHPGVVAQGGWDTWMERKIESTF